MSVHFRSNELNPREGTVCSRSLTDVQRHQGWSGLGHQSKGVHGTGKGDDHRGMASGTAPATLLGPGQGENEACLREQGHWGPDCNAMPSLAAA